MGDVASSPIDIPVGATVVDPIIGMGGDCVGLRVDGVEVGARVVGGWVAAIGGVAVGWNDVGNRVGDKVGEYVVGCHVGDAEGIRVGGNDTGGAAVGWSVPNPS